MYLIVSAFYYCTNNTEFKFLSSSPLARACGSVCGSLAAQPAQHIRTWNILEQVNGCQRHRIKAPPVSVPSGGKQTAPYRGRSHESPTADL